MKIIITICAAILMTTNLLLPKKAIAQAPNKMSYQAVIRNSSNSLIANQVVGMQISILQGSSNGTAVYIETQTPNTNLNGLASLEIGTGTLVIGSFSTINWANGPYFIKTETDPSGGTNYSISGTSQLLSVPYALYAANAGIATGGGNFTHFIGEQFGGGIIFHLWKDALGVEHGLVADIYNTSGFQEWSSVSSTSIGSSAQTSWNGLSNSNAIFGQAGHLYSAAALCLNYSIGGKNDWYLPSLDELSLLWQNRFNVNKALSSIGGADLLPISASFWSSTESSASTAWLFNFAFGNIEFSNKYNSRYVRAVRAF
jgi:hypothetical protein